MSVADIPHTACHEMPDVSAPAPNDVPPLTEMARPCPPEPAIATAEPMPHTPFHAELLSPTITGVCQPAFVCCTTRPRPPTAITFELAGSAHTAFNWRSASAVSS